MALLISFLTRGGIIIPVKWGLEKKFEGLEKNLKDLVGTLTVTNLNLTRKDNITSDFKAHSNL